MLRAMRPAAASLVALAACAGAALAGDLTEGLKAGTPDLKSAGALAFGPDGVLFAADQAGGAVFAIDTGDRGRARSQAPAAVNVEGIDAKVAGMLGTTADQILIREAAVNPASGKVYLSVARGRGPDAAGVIVRVGPDGEVQELPLTGVKFAKAELSGLATGRGRQDSITDLAFVDGRVFVAGLSNEEFSSNLRVIPFPFAGPGGQGAHIEIYHGSHGRFETTSPVRTFIPYEIEGKPHVLAAYTCTPLVKFPVADLRPGARVKGTTIAELGNHNKPLDMIVYQKDGRDFILMSNSSRGVMKIPADRAARQEGIIRRVSDTAGLPFETVAGLKGVEQLDKLGNESAVVLAREEGGRLDLKTIPLP
ncbi:hypothetical protein OJF2_42530 [Aquisphaera giovannonii]|uniref:Uncharacterized protein n=1 Tax=Aquisphaera giovannonii TaxID=406548 RepID=A0A5B9W4U5_9BACT|nr:hypothetical protein [Aquisphaera giovannonii]QEH35696.1 hypothetical protein OJF2_42530 [Aquisphaera giovannonii]